MKITIPGQQIPQEIKMFSLTLLHWTPYSIETQQSLQTSLVRAETFYKVQKVSFLFILTMYLKET